MEVQLHAFLTSALDGGDWSASRPDLFTAGKRIPGTHWVGGWVGQSADLEAVAKREIPFPAPAGKSKLGCPALSLVTILSDLSFSKVFPRFAQPDVYPYCSCDYKSINHSAMEQISHWVEGKKVKDV
jgi:hypothetical protein